MSTSNDYLMFITNDSAEANTVHASISAVHDKKSVVLHVCAHDL